MSNPFLILVREFFSSATDEEASDILWGRTAFPFDCSSLREQLAAAKSHDDAGRRQCDFCMNAAADGDCLCAACSSALKSLKNNQ